MHQALQKMQTLNLASLPNSDKLMMLEVPDIVTVDTEGMGTMLGFSACFDGITEGLYFPFTHARGNMTSKEQKFALEILKKKTLVHHNAVHDIEVLRKAGLTAVYPFYDTMLMAHWTNEEMVNFSLDAVSKYYGGQPKAMPDQMSRIIDSDGWNAVPVGWMHDYSGNDAYITHQLFRTLLPMFQAENFDGPLWEREQKFIRTVIIPMIRRGVKVDVGFCIREYMRGQTIMDECLAELKFKPTSPVALEKFLIQELELPVVKHTKACKKCYPEDRKIQGASVSTHHAKPSFDKDAMEQYDTMLERKDDVRAKTILRYRGWLKTNSSNYKPYMNLVDDNHVLHPGYKLHGTKTSRLSCAEPNLQQIPKSSDKDWNGNLKSAFIPRVGFGLWSVDYSQLQFRMACAYAGQEDLIAIFNDVVRDIFQEMASDMAWIRDDIKTLVYLIMFGGGGKRASVAFGVPISQGKEIVEEFYARYPEIKKIANNAQRAAQRQGYVAYWTGRRRHFRKNLMPTGMTPQFYRAFNAVIQGGEAEIIKLAMIMIAEEVCDENCWLILQIHDEIVFEIKEGMEDEYLPRIQALMEKAGEEFCNFVSNKVIFKTSAGKWGNK